MEILYFDSSELPTPEVIERDPMSLRITTSADVLEIAETVRKSGTMAHEEQAVLRAIRNGDLWCLSLEATTLCDGMFVCAPYEAEDDQNSLLVAHKACSPTHSMRRVVLRAFDKDHGTEFESSCVDRMVER